MAEMNADGARRRIGRESHAKLDDKIIVAAVTDAARRGRIPQS